MRTPLRLAILSGLTVLVSGPVALAAPAAPTITEFPLPQAGTTPLGIAAWPNGTLLFAQGGAQNEYGVSTTTGSVSELSGLTGSTSGVAVADGHDWLTEPAANRIVRADGGGQFTEIPLPEAGSQPTGITAGPGGTVWFTEAGNPARIGSLSANGTITGEYTSGLTPDSQPGAITQGPDGNLWFTEAGDPGRIGEINPTTHVITEYPTPTVNSQPTSITAGPDGNLWFTEAGDPGRIGEINPTTHVITEYPTPTANSRPTAIAPGPGGDLWFTEAANPGAIGWITPQGAISELPTPTPDSQPTGIVEGSDGNVWFTEDGASGQLGRLTLPLPTTLTAPAIAVGQTKATLTGTIDPNGFDSTYHFEWGAAAADEHPLPAVDADAGGGTLQTPVAHVLTGLTPGTTYHYRLIASNCGGCAAGTSEGATATFTTAPAGTPQPPVMGHTAVARVTSGRVLVRVRGSRRLQPLAAGRTIPLGSLIDARRGRLDVTTEISRHGRVQTAAVWGGDFVIGQTGGRGMTTFRIPVAALACPARARHLRSNAIHAVSTGGRVRARVRRRRTMSLWARDNHGRYSTRGHNSVATVRGTEWRTVETCRGTLTFVKRGVVSVRDLHTHRTVLVHAGHSFLARR